MFGSTNNATRPAMRAVAVAVAACAAVLPLAACGNSGTPSTAPSAAATTTAAGRTAVTVNDPWIKTAASGMTAVFGTLHNSGGTSMTVVSATTSGSARAELHEVVMTGEGMKMRPKEGGFVVEAGKDHVLKPGGDHIMVMDLTGPIRAGDQVEVTLTMADGSTTAFTALAKDSSGGQESYVPSASGMQHAPTTTGMQHG